MSCEKVIKNMECCIIEDCENCKKEWSCVSQWDCMRNLMRTAIAELNLQKYTDIAEKHIKSEAIKEFVEKLKKYKFEHRIFGRLTYEELVKIKDIDNLLKEMTE